jgi:hypothetical protein
MTYSLSSIALDGATFTRTQLDTETLFRLAAACIRYANGDVLALAAPAFEMLSSTDFDEAANSMSSIAQFTQEAPND